MFCEYPELFHEATVYAINVERSDPYSPQDPFRIMSTGDVFLPAGPVAARCTHPTLHSCVIALHAHRGKSPTHLRIGLPDVCLGYHFLLLTSFFVDVPNDFF